MNSPDLSPNGGTHLSDEELNAYLDERRVGLAPGNAAVTAHLARCPACAKTYGELLATVELLSALPQQEPTRRFALTPAMVAGSDPRPATRSHPRWIWPARWASIAAAIALATTIGLEAGTQPATPARGSRPADAAVLVTAIARTTVESGAVANRASGTSARDGLQSAAAPPPAPSEVRAFGLTPTIFPTPTAVPAPVVIPPASQASVPWRTIEGGIGAVALVLATLGFAVPPLFRRRGGAPSA